MWDILPTFMDLAGITVPTQILDGKSWVHSLIVQDITEPIFEDRIYRRKSRQQQQQQQQQQHIGCKNNSILSPIDSFEYNLYSMA